MKMPCIRDRAALCFIAYVMIIGLMSLPGFMVSNLTHKFSLGDALRSTLPFAIALPSTVGGMPVVLSNHDRDSYSDAFKAQQGHDWKTADTALAQASNSLLKGHVLAERYLSRKYEPTVEEFQAWLIAYRDLPQAYEISQLQQRLYNFAVPYVSKPSLISMRGDDNGLAANFDESKHYTTWRQGIAAYHGRDYTKAADMFGKMIADRNHLSPWKVSAAGFWSWRANMELGQKEKAMASLLIAAGEPRSFYGILARKQLGRKLELDQTELSLSDEQAESLARYPAVIRATALVQANRSDLAERELRQLYSSLGHDDRYALLCLSHQFSLPALQIAIAKRLESGSNQFDLAKYPIPEWEPIGGFSVDPALIYALVRQESGFRNGAISPAGAMGLMQLMPTTASMMADKLGAYQINGASDAEKNITLGQSYVRHLLQNQLVENNMIFMLAAYNAGIGRLQEWKNSIDYRNDPLLFIERMPYAETRHYVMQVMTNYWLYNEILGISSPTLAALAEQRWPVYIAAKELS